ncbi:hypothetical protein HUN58_03330 [Curtobacterium sp. Csp1]|nr:hypothetical protein [Curtobacterium sp. Csp1]QKS19066.1 hypothetical protein HUN58_03330 [Curtobacterium sp. Csp1]
MTGTEEPDGAGQLGPFQDDFVASMATWTPPEDAGPEPGSSAGRKIR